MLKFFWKNYETHVSGNILSSGNLSLREKCIFPHSDGISLRIYLYFVSLRIHSNTGKMMMLMMILMMLYVTDTKAGRNQIIVK